MPQNTSPSTLTVEGLTPFAQVPRWILRAGKRLSHGAVRLYGVIMSYADNDTRAAFPGREKLSEDMGVKEWSISKYIKELEEFGAMRVERRRSKRTGNFYANHYTLIFTRPAQPDPHVEEHTPPDVPDHPIPIPTVLPRSTSSSTADESSPGFTVNLRSPAPTNPGDLTNQERSAARTKLQLVGKLMSEGRSFTDDDVDEAWFDFATTLTGICDGKPYGDLLADLLLNGKWTVTERVASPYVAGAELNKMIHTAIKEG